MRLSEKERIIISAVEFNPDIPLSHLQRITHCRSHTIRYCIRKLCQQGIIRYYPFVNVYPLGLTPYCLYFSFSAEGGKAKQRVLKALVDSPRVSWVAEVGGKYHCCASILARHVKEVRHFLYLLSEKQGNLFFEKSLSTEISYTHFGAKYLHIRKPPYPCRQWGQNGKQVVLDETDYKILYGLISQNYGSRRELARLLNLPSSTLEGRIKKLTEKGIITGFKYMINSQKLGMQTFKLLVYTRGGDPDQHERLYNLCAEHPNISSMVNCMGTWDYELTVDVKESADVLKIAHYIQSKQENTINHLEVIPVFKKLKVACFPFASGQDLEPKLLHHKDQPVQKSQSKSSKKCSSMQRFTKSRLVQDTTEISMAIINRANCMEEEGVY
jgi:Lrp/AsnC family transcriptional regulator, leucine-responsive regulatory protein